ncbi:SDR family oxidoreductase [Rhodococcus sp. HM1]|uniref:SDR family NAD(P)-dependent oxidoreductase n=1 Tax=unclassified Rhodococcus (in: high G+C Gram-positive bacteria) TaxID=192944 RepID=UPI0018CE23D7|nr:MULTISPECIES: SDR family oxidoreductase [unclassified Rhodococcus (in: high G+C Gram-positive bacteria)]MBH0121974.1 SDR family oxidoreductase [Rhodococcus sp. CX]MCK8670662.1 SDR family oxidoreductase [Rhodococcus sp. HM1]
MADRAAIVTGASRGIGRAVALELAAAGAAVVVNGRAEDAVHDTVAEIEAAGGRAVGVAGSAAAPGVAEALLAAALDEFGDVDALINCAGIAEPSGSSILSVTDEQWHELLDAHLTGTFRTCRTVAPHLVARGGGAIVNTSSFAFLGDYGGTGYPAGKGAVNSLTLAIAAELREQGVRANAVCPGARTRLSTGDEYERQIEQLHRRGLLDDVSYQGSLDPAPPEFVARLYAYLVDGRSAGVTGEIFAGSGCFVGRFPRPRPSLLAWRDHKAEPPWTIEEIAGFVGG